MAPSTINRSFSISVGLMTLTLRRGMGLRVLTEVSNWYCLLAVFTTVLQKTLTASTSADVQRECAVKENVWNKKWNIVTMYAQMYLQRERRGNTQRQKRREREKTHKQIFIQTWQYVHKRHRDRAVWLHPKPLLSGIALRMYDCDFQIMCVISQSGRFSNCPIMIYLAIQ